TAVTDSFFTIDATISLLKFDAGSGEDERSVTLSWATDPGREADVRSRLERAANQSGMFAPLHAGLLDQGEYLDRDPGASARYRLIAVNGLGEEYVLGETSVAGALAPDREIAAYPNPSSEGPVRILFRVPLEKPIEVTVYDV